MRHIARSRPLQKNETAQPCSIRFGRFDVSLDISQHRDNACHPSDARPADQCEKRCTES